MNCGDVERLLDAHLDGELSGSLRLEFEAHRLHCPRCQQMLAMMEACMHVIATDQNEPALRDDFTDRLMSRLAEHKPPRQRVWRLRPVAMWAAVGAQAAAVILVAVFWFGSRPSAPPALPDPRVARVEAFDQAYAEVVGALGRGIVDRLEGGAALSPEWASLAQYFNLELPESYAQQTRDLAAGDPFSFFMSAFLPSGGSAAPSAPVAADDSFSL